jgi:Domain of unknown function (DUF4249)
MNTSQHLYRFSALLLLTATCALGCEEIVENPELPYVEKLVVGAILENGATEVVVYFSRTQPLSQSYVSENAELYNVVGRVVANGLSFPLEHIGQGIYSTSGLTVQSGIEYELFAEWNGKRAYARTRVPYPVNVEAAKYACPPGQYTFCLESVVLPREHEVYGQTWEVQKSDGRIERGGVFGTVLRKLDAGPDGRIILSDSYDHMPLGQGDIVYTRVHAFDEPYYDYFISNGDLVNGGEDDFFLSSGTFVNWNVTGDAIGMFIGKTVTRRKVE